jgi:hypothetical protein
MSAIDGLGWPFLYTYISFYVREILSTIPILDVKDEPHTLMPIPRQSSDVKVLAEKILGKNGLFETAMTEEEKNKINERGKKISTKSFPVSR